MYRVMIIDDEPIIVQGLSKSIRWDKWDCQVVATASNGVEGIDMLQKVKPDILISDICMPKLDGLTMIAGIKSEIPRMEVTILTGFRDFDYAQQAIRLGVTRFLLKPSRMDELEEAISKMTQNLRESEKTADVAKEMLSDERKPDEELEGEKNEAGSFIVNNALSYIRENYQQKLKLADVAEKVYVSQWHLSKLLNRYEGQSFSDILNNVRIEKAKELLKDPALRIGDIAEHVGFLDMAHFSRVFKKQTGVSANEYRNTIGKKN